MPVSHTEVQTHSSVSFSFMLYNKINVDLQYLQLLQTDCSLVNINLLTDPLHLPSRWPCGFQLWCLQRAGGAENLWNNPEDLWKHLLSCEHSWHQQVSRQLSRLLCWSPALSAKVHMGIFINGYNAFHGRNLSRPVLLCVSVGSGMLCYWGLSRRTWWLCFTPTCWAPCWPAEWHCAACCTPRELPLLILVFTASASAMNSDVFSIWPQGGSVYHCYSH